MPTYVLLSTLTPEGHETLHKNPDRVRAVDEEIKKLGCKVISQYALLGAYDFLTIIEAPDNETVAHLSVDLGSRRTANFTTLPAISIEDFAAKLKGPEHLAR
ncbi:MAG: GYD domain-containing protein [Burkholderiales bacterium]